MLKLNRKTINHNTGVSTFASPTSPSTDQSLQKSFHLSHSDKIELIKIQPFKKNKKYSTHSQHSMTRQLNNDNGLLTRGTNTTGYNSTYPKGGVSCSKDSFVDNQTLVFQIKFCGKSPALRVAANR
jgi:hypothetical protein